MGGRYWNISSYEAAAAARRATGANAFDYDDMLRRSVAPSKWTVHEELDPKRLNSRGENVREALDTDEHPNATPIAIIFDVTGSMRGIPRVLQQKLPQLHGILQRGGYVQDPEILFGAVGDAYSDRVPLQIGQFESDNRMDEGLEHLVLEGGGGGGNHESYELMAYYIARHAQLSCLKRGKKGYLFFIGDERLYGHIKREQVERLIGDKLQADLTTAEIFAELQRQFEVFFLFAAQGSYQPEQVLTRKYPDHEDVCYWRDLLGQRALILEDANAVCETIALAIGLMEGTVSLDEGLDDLREAGVARGAITAAGNALARISGGTKVARTSGSLPDLPHDGTTGTTRL